MRCLAARVNYKTLIIICTLFTLITVLLWNRCSSDTSLRFLPRAALVAPSPKVGDSSISSQQHPPQPPEPPPVVGVVGGIKYEEIDCLINDDTTIKGRRDGGEVYMPFSWMEKYFEVYGKVVQYDGYDRFEFQHSYSKVYAQREPYHPDGVFMSFEGYNVEVRDRVKCISGVEDCERGLWTIMRVKTTLRNRLKAQTLNNLLMICIQGADAEDFNFDSACDNWVSMCKRRLSVTTPI